MNYPEILFLSSNKKGLSLQDLKEKNFDTSTTFFFTAKGNAYTLDLFRTQWRFAHYHAHISLWRGAGVKSVTGDIKISSKTLQQIRTNIRDEMVKLWFKEGESLIPKIQDIDLGKSKDEKLTKKELVEALLEEQKKKTVISLDEKREFLKKYKLNNYLIAHRKGMSLQGGVNLVGKEIIKIAEKYKVEGVQDTIEEILAKSKKEEIVASDLLNFAMEIIKIKNHDNSLENYCKRLLERIISTEGKTYSSSIPKFYFAGSYYSYQPEYFYGWSEQVILATIGYVIRGKDEVHTQSFPNFKSFVTYLNLSQKQKRDLLEKAVPGDLFTNTIFENLVRAYIRGEDDITRTEQIYDILQK